jgi:hypothetical protein
MDAYRIPSKVGRAVGTWMCFGSLQWNPSLICPRGCNKRQDNKTYRQSNQYLLSIHEVTPFYILIFPEKLSLHWVAWRKPHQLIDGDAP